MDFRRFSWFEAFKIVILLRSCLRRSRQSCVDLQGGESRKKQVFVRLRDREPMANGARKLKKYILCSTDESITYQLPLPEINDCVFGKERIKLQKQCRVYVRLGFTLVRMLVQND